MYKDEWSIVIASPIKFYTSFAKLCSMQDAYIPEYAELKTHLVVYQNEFDIRFYKNQIKNYDGRKFQQLFLEGNNENICEDIDPIKTTQGESFFYKQVVDTPPTKFQSLKQALKIENEGDDITTYFKFDYDGRYYRK